mmetsp:Transcript_23051/g.22805  ORF Transcript_23051/g.22805 Transcript_23051/m.22805 type:complete len:301 (+) Transcript_23051:6-908(+)
MSIIVSTPGQIASAPTNRSTAKQQWSFSKASRFSALKPTEAHFYSIPPAFDKRSASIGYGTKSDFTKERGQGNPDPSAYNLPSDFDNKKPFGLAYSFGISREACEKRYVEGHFKADPSVPGPGTYPITSKIGQEGRKFTFRPRTSILDEMFNSRKSPGPGAYDPKSEVEKGRYTLSTFKNAGITTFSPLSSPRFPKDQKNGLPGPGAYYNSEDFLKSGYYLSKFQSPGNRAFPISNRDSSPTSGFWDTPGPGSYRLPSEFGYYESKNKALDKRPNTQSMPNLKSQRTPASSQKPKPVTRN